MGSLQPVNVDVTIGKDCATDGANGYRLFFHAHFFNDFGNELVNNTVRTSRAIVHADLIHQGRLGIDQVLRLYDFFFCHDSSLLRENILIHTSTPLISTAVKQQAKK